jgi:putative zinc finger/helix-turn-helix YgiT family protein
MKHLPETFPTTSPACAFCGSNDVSARNEPIHFEYAGPTAVAQLTTVVRVNTCAECGGEFADSSIEDAKHEAVCRHIGALTPSDIIALRAQHDLSRAELSHLTGLGAATVARWERGVLIQTLANDRFLRLLQFPENLERLKQILARPTSSPRVIDFKRFAALRDITDKERESASSFKLRL